MYKTYKIYVNDAFITTMKGTSVEDIESAIFKHYGYGVNYSVKPA